MFCTRLLFFFVIWTLNFESTPASDRWMRCYKGQNTSVHNVPLRLSQTTQLKAASTTAGTTTTTTTRSKKSFLVTTTTTSKGLFMIQGDMHYNDCYEWCEKKGGRLIRIDSQEKQNQAAAVARTSGLQCVAIGVYVKNFRWIYGDGNRITFKAWAKNEPKAFGFFAAMSRETDYLWVAVSRVNGGVCEHF